MVTYHLVLQWPASSVEDYDSMIEIESALIGRLSEDNEVDGHDAGSGQVNIFIVTKKPVDTFNNEIKPILEIFDALSDVKVAYRNTEETHYTVIWPQGLTEFKIL